MLRKTLVILAVLLCNLATQVYALGLGTVTVESALNQPLRVRIELLQLGDTRVEDVIVQMASTDDFLRFNIDRVGFLSNIRFDIQSAAGGNFVILTSTQLVREPYLSFILETRWPSGRLLSEHTVLLDLPVFDDQVSSTAPAIRQPISPVLQAPDVDQSAQPFVEPSAVVPTPGQVVERPSADQIQPEVITPQPVPSEPVDTQQQPEAAPVSEEQSSSADAASAETQPEVVATEAEVSEEPAEEPVQEPEQQVAEPTTDSADADSQSSDEPEPEVLVETDEQAVEQAEEEVQAPEEALSDEAIPDEAVVDADAADANEANEEEAGPESVETGVDDTLSAIAMEVQPDSASLEQTMLAIQQENPDAFGDGNINNMRSGQVLRIPSAEEIQAIDAREAADEVSRQNQEFAVADAEPLAAPSTATPDQDAVQQGQLSVVNSDDNAIDASNAGTELNQQENDELDIRIAELETQLAVQQEEADRARIEREEVDQRLTELEEQITAATEIIRLQDLQLAQLQESLAQAAVDAAATVEQQAEVNAIEDEINTPVAPSAGLMDDVLRILTGNTLFMIFGIFLAISLIVVLLLRRNRAASQADEELDEIAKGEFDGATADDSMANEEEEAARKGADLQDYNAAELDEELDDIIGVSDELEQTESDTDTAFDVLSEAKRLQDQGELDRSESLLTAALEENSQNLDARWLLAEVLMQQGETEAFEEHALALIESGGVEAESRLSSLRESLTAEANAVSQANEEEKAETASFLDDLGIDLDAFDDFDDASDAEPESSEQSEAQVEETTAAPEPEAEPVIEDALTFDPDEVDLTFDLAGDDNEGEDTAEDETARNESAGELSDSGYDAAEEGGLEFSSTGFDDIPGGDSKEAEDLDIDTFEFNADEASAADVEEVVEAEEEADVESVSFDTEGVATAEELAEKEEDVESNPDDENAVDFDFDKDTLNEEESAAPELEPELEVEEFEFEAPEDPAPSAEVEVEDTSSESMETFDFDLDGSADTLVENTTDESASEAETVEESEAVDEPEDEAEEEGVELDVEWDADTDSVEEVTEPAPEDELDVAEDEIKTEESSSAEGDFDFDLDEYATDEASDASETAEAESTEEEPVFDFDEEIDEPAVVIEDSVQSEDVNLLAEEEEEEEEGQVVAIEDEGDQIDSVEDEFEIESLDDDEDLDFLSDANEPELDSVESVEEVELLSDDDEAATKLELAYAYQKMGDTEGAQEILQEVVAEGSDEQVVEAKKLLESLANTQD